jgi:hypothetical protein
MFSTFSIACISEANGIRMTRNNSLALSFLGSAVAAESASAEPMSRIE